jgi:hypothetical protein
VNPEVEIKDMMASKRPGEEENDFAMVVKRQRTEQSNNQLGVTSEVQLFNLFGFLLFSENRSVLERYFFLGTKCKSS